MSGFRAAGSFDVASSAMLVIGGARLPMAEADCSFVDHSQQPFYENWGSGPEYKSFAFMPSFLEQACSGNRMRWSMKALADGLNWKKGHLTALQP